MSRIVCIGFALFLCSFFGIRAQIPNPGFESWNGNQPDGWRAYWTQPYSPFSFESKVPQAKEGNWALRSDILLTGRYYNPSGIYSGSESTGYYFPVSGKVRAFKGWYILGNKGLDTLTIQISMKKEGLEIGRADLNILEPTSEYKAFIVPIEYEQNEEADSMRIEISFNHGIPWSGHEGSHFIIDDLALDILGSDQNITHQEQYLLSPNPAAEWVSLLPSTLSGPCTLIVRDCRGVRILSRSYEKGPVSWDVSDWPGGLYFIQLLQNGVSLFSDILARP